MTDVVLDTNILADLLAQYYESGFSQRGYFEPYRTLNSALIREINKIIRWHTGNLWETNSNHVFGLVIASTFAFVEIARKFEQIADNRFTIDQFFAFLEQPPEWFYISSVDYSILPNLVYLPPDIEIGELTKPIELADSIQLATAMSRDDCVIATTDARMRKISFLNFI